MGTGPLTGWEILARGGPLMIPLLLCSILTVMIVAEKLWSFAKVPLDIHSLKKALFDDIRTNQIKKAIERCEEHSSPTAKILKAGILNFGSALPQIKEAMEAASLQEIPKLEKNLGALLTLAHLAPLLGFLGTVTGMTMVFYTIQQRAEALNPSSPGDLAGGIWQALLTTVTGLVVAIPAYLAYNFCVSRVHALVLQMEQSATEFAAFLSSVTESKQLPKSEKGDYPLEI